MITIYHNNRCRKSREGLEVLENSGKEYRIREYLKEPLDEQEIRLLLDKLNMTPIQLVRKNENNWKDNYKGKDLSDSELITILADNPEFIERPVVETAINAVIGRPSSQIEKIL